MTDKTEDYQQDWQAFMLGQKRLVIFEQTGDAAMYYDRVIEASQGAWPHVHVFRMQDDRRQETWAIAIADSRTVRDKFITLLYQQPSMPRPVFQYQLGRLLDYSIDDIREFIDSDLGKSCPCTLCGKQSQLSKGDTLRRLSRQHTYTNDPGYDAYCAREAARITKERGTQS